MNPTPTHCQTARRSPNTAIAKTTAKTKLNLSMTETIEAGPSCRARKNSNHDKPVVRADKTRNSRLREGTSESGRHSPARGQAPAQTGDHNGPEERGQVGRNLFHPDFCQNGRQPGEECGPQRIDLPIYFHKSSRRSRIGLGQDLVVHAAVNKRAHQFLRVHALRKSKFDLACLIQCF